MCSASSSAVTAGPKRWFRNLVKVSCSMIKNQPRATGRELRAILKTRSLVLPESRVHFKPRLDHHGRYGQAQAPQEATKGQSGTFEYSIGNGSDQRVSNQEAQHN